MKKSPIVLSPDAIKLIESIVSAGNNALITTGKNGLTVYKQKNIKEYAQSQVRD